MNSTYHWPCRLRLVPHLDSKDLFDVGITYYDFPQEQVYHRVHVPEALRTILRKSPPTAIQMETLEINGAASRALPGAPQFVIVALTDSQKVQYWHVPEAWSRLRQRNAAFAISVTVAAVVLAGWMPSATPPASLAVVALAAAVTFVLLRAGRIHASAGFRPFFILAQLGRPVP